MYFILELNAFRLHYLLSSDIYLILILFQQKKLRFQTRKCDKI